MIMEETKKLIQNFNEIEKQVRESIEKSIIEKIGFDNYLQLSETCIYIDASCTFAYKCHIPFHSIINCH